MDVGSGTSKRPAPRGTAAYPRKRAVAACQTCRSRKTKCDNRRPTCSFCERAGATCNYSTQDLSAYDPASLAILDRLDNLERSLKHQISLVPASIASASPGTSPSTIMVPSPAVHDETSSNHATGNVSISEGSSLAITVEHILAWPVFEGQFQEQTNLAQLLRTSRQLDQPGNANFDLDIGTCRRLLESCFEHVLSKNPVLEEDSLRKTMNSVCMNGVEWTSESCLVLLVCALGSIASPDATPSDWIVARSYFSAAQRRIGMLLTSPGLIAAQCYFLAGVYFMYSISPLEAWRMFAQAVTCIYPEYPVSTPPGQYSLEECVYWSCWKSEVELRMNLRLSSFGGGGVVGDQYPQHIPEPPVTTDASHEPKWYYYLADISLRRLELNIRDTVSAILKRKTSMGSRYRELVRVVPTLEEQLQDWVRSSPDIFTVHESEETILQFIIGGRLLDSYDVLYIPFLEAALSTPSFSEDVASLVDDYARKALDCCAERFRERKPGFATRHHGTWLMLRTSTRSSLMILATCISGRLDLLPDGWQNALAVAAYSLNIWKDESYDVKAQLEIILSLSAKVGLDLSADMNGR